MTATAPRLIPLTTRQQTIYRWLARYWHERGMPPSVREMQQAFNFGSPNGAYCHLLALRRKRWLRVEERGVVRGFVPSQEALDHDAG